ncbi:MAG: 3-deoxy-D-manno-octulosonic acid transferase [Bacteroidia bacterium]
MRSLYNLSIHLLQLVFSIGRFFNSKINQGYKGRQNWRHHLINFKKNNPGKLIWFHCASLGEFEMARPVIDELNANPLEDAKILITFFSPSGYELRKNFKDADGVMYMPLDTPKNAIDFVTIAQPFISIFVKYEFWLNHLEQLKIQGSKVLLINGLFRKEQSFFQWWGAMFREALKNFDILFLQNKNSQKLIHSLDVYPHDSKYEMLRGDTKQGTSASIRVPTNRNINTIVTGDLRYDRVMTISKTAKQFPQLNLFIKDSFVIIGGSTWPEEEWILQQCLNSLGDKIKLIIAPHDVSEKHLKQIENRFSKNKLKRFTEMKPEDNPEIILVDTVGHLSSLYQCGTVALVGGGFAGALHNIIEPAVFGIPVFFGYKHSKFPEADYFKKNKIGISIHNGFNFTEHMKELLANPKKLETIKHKTPMVFKSHLGGTHQVYYKIVGYWK